MTSCISATVDELLALARPRLGRLSLAAAALQDLGLVGATDLVGGLRAWAAAGLPAGPGTTQPGSVLSERP